MPCSCSSKKTSSYLSGCSTEVLLPWAGSPLTFVNRTVHTLEPDPVSSPPSIQPRELPGGWLWRLQRTHSCETNGLKLSPWSSHSECNELRISLHFSTAQETSKLCWRPLSSSRIPPRVEGSRALKGYGNTYCRQEIRWKSNMWDLSYLFWTYMHSLLYWYLWLPPFSPSEVLPRLITPCW